VIHQFLDKTMQKLTRCPSRQPS